MTISEISVQSKICVGENGLYYRVIWYSVCCWEPNSNHRGKKPEGPPKSIERWRELERWENQTSCEWAGLFSSNHFRGSQDVNSCHCCIHDCLFIDSLFSEVFALDGRNFKWSPFQLVACSTASTASVLILLPILWCL